MGAGKEEEERGLAVEWDRLRASGLKLLRTWIGEPETEARQWLIKVCDSLDTPAAVGIIAELTNDTDSSVSAAAAGVLARRADGRGLSVLKTLVRSGSWRVRQTVAEELGRSCLADSLE